LPHEIDQFPWSDATAPKKFKGFRLTNTELPVPDPKLFPMGKGNAEGGALD
jgi:hypothetical protein